MVQRTPRLDGAPELDVTTRPALFTPEELAGFKARLAPRLGLDLDAYKPRQIERRITALLCRSGLRQLDEFADLLEADPRRLRDFVDGLTINVSEFFRNPEKWEELETVVLPLLFERHDEVVIWSAGCSMGAELYSVGILLDEMGLLERARLIGTDLDRGSLAQAESCLYGPHELGAVSPARFARYFTPADKQYHFVAPHIQARAEFFQHNLLMDPPVAACHLVICRNVVIYLNEASKQKLYRGFHEALVPGGVLFVGGTERIFACRELGFDSFAPFFYQKALPGAVVGF